jgi:hypothetical protein
MKPILAAIMMVSSLLLLVGCSDRPSDVVTKVIRAMEQGDVDAAVSHIHPDHREELRRLGLEGQAEVSRKELEQLGGIKRIEILEEDIDEDSATLQIRLTFGNGETESDRFELVKIDGRWYIWD